MGYGNAPLKNKTLKSKKNIIHFPYQTEIRILRLMSESSTLKVTIFHEIIGHAILRLCTYDISFGLNIKDTLNVNKKKTNLKIEYDIFSSFFFHNAH